MTSDPSKENDLQYEREKAFLETRCPFAHYPIINITLIDNLRCGEHLCKCCFYGRECCNKVGQRMFVKRFFASRLFLYLQYYVKERIFSTHLHTQNSITHQCSAKSNLLKKANNFDKPF